MSGVRRWRICLLLDDMMLADAISVDRFKRADDGLLLVYVASISAVRFHCLKYLELRSAYSATHGEEHAEVCELESCRWVSSVLHR